MIDILMMPGMSWLWPGSVVGLATVLWYMGRKGLEKLESIETRLDTMDKFMATELRALDVRITRLEAHAWPHR